MNRAIVFVTIIVRFCNACSPPKNERPSIHLQMRISGVGLAKIESGVFSRGKQEFLMYGDPAQEMHFRNSDTINNIFPLGKKDNSGRLDTTAIGHGETLSFAFTLKENKTARSRSINSKPLLRATILADGKAIKSIELPAMPSRSSRHDSTASLIVYTDSL